MVCNVDIAFKHHKYKADMYVWMYVCMYVRMYVCMYIIKDT